MTDTSMAALTKAINTIGTSFEEYKKVADEMHAAGKAGQESLRAELDQKLAKIEATLTEATKTKTAIETEMKLQRERIEDLESKATSPGKTAKEKAAEEYKSTLLDWVRNKGNSPMLEQKLHDLMRKDVTIASPAGGGYAVPEDISRQIGQLLQKLSPVRNLVKVVPVGTSDYKELIDINGATAGWVGESDSRSATNTPQLRERAPTHGELYAYPQVSEWSLDDIFFNVENWLSESVARAFAIAEASAVISGNGTNKPTGMLNTAPVTTSDEASPKRAAAAYQYILGGDNSPASVDADALIDLMYALNSGYRANATWIMNSITTGQVRKLKASGTGEYLWQPSLQAGQPDMILGKPISTWEQLSDPVGGSFPVAFGDFKQGYLLTERTGLRITRDNVTNVGYVRFYVRQRVGGCVLNNDAVKWLKLL
jgi:HK97 family phage major capsid protein